jgi:membrane-bound serine protease (ClpP class)
MEFMLDPNVAYLLLLTGVLLGVLAALTPGTGLLEIGALFSLAGAGYAAYRLPFNWWALLILALSVVPFVLAFQNPKRDLWLAVSIAGLLLGAALTFGSESGWPAVNPVLALVASALAGAFLWIAVRKSMQAAHGKPAHNVEGLIGQLGESKTRVHDEGSVQVAGELWSARSEKAIPDGTPIRVIDRDGFVLVVEKSDPGRS